MIAGKVRGRLQCQLVRTWYNKQARPEKKVAVGDGIVEGHVLCEDIPTRVTGNGE